MKIPELFKEYIWLIEAINRYGKITFAELNELWKRKEESPLKGNPLTKSYDIPNQ